MALHFDANPAAVLLGRSSAIGFFVNGSLAHRSVENLASYIATIDTTKSVDATTLLYSPIFQCYTTLPFYAAALAECKRLVELLDTDCHRKLSFLRHKRNACLTHPPTLKKSEDASSEALFNNVKPYLREAFWASLACIVGAKREPTTDALQPALDAIVNAPRINILDVEVFYSSLLLALHICGPAGMVKNKPWDTLQQLQETAKKTVLSFFTYIRQNSKSPFKHNISLHQLRLLRTSSPTNATGTNTDVASQLMNAQEMMYITTLQQLMMLLHWVSALDALPQELKQRIWDSCKNIPSLRNYTVNTSFKELVNTWMSSPYHNMSAIAGLFSAISMLHDQKILSDDFRQIDITKEALQEMLNSSVGRLSPTTLPNFAQTTSPVTGGVFPMMFNPSLELRPVTPYTTAIPFNLTSPPGIERRPSSAPAPSNRSLSPVLPNMGRQSTIVALSNVPPAAAKTPILTRPPPRLERTASGTSDTSSTESSIPSKSTLRTSSTSAFSPASNTKKRKHQDESLDKGEAKAPKIAEDSTPSSH